MKKLTPSQKRLAALHSFLQSLPWLPSSYQVTPHVSESSNQTFVVASSAQRYFVKHFHATSFMPFDRLERFEVQNALADCGWAPKPLALSDNCLWQIEQFVEVKRETSIQTLAEVMVKLHSSFTLTGGLPNTSPIPKQIKELALISHWHLYLSYINQDKHAECLSEIEKLTPLWQSVEKNTLCHHDLSLNHVAMNANQHMVFDWEYAAISHPAFDVACAIMANNFSLTKATHLVFAYMEAAHQRGYLKNDTESDFAKQVAEMMPLVQLTNRLWFEAYHQHGH